MQTSILNKYFDARLPWYTIYPTVPQFSAAVGPEACEQWLRRMPAEEPVSLYLHVPFCRSICWYCGLPTKMTQRDAPILNYLAVLREEIRLVAEQVPQGLLVSDIHFGGGSPTLIKPTEFFGLGETLAAARRIQEIG